MNTVQELINVLNAFPNKEVPLKWEMEYIGLSQNWITETVEPEVIWKPTGITIHLTTTD